MRENVGATAPLPTVDVMAMIVLRTAVTRQSSHSACNNRQILKKSAQKQAQGPWENGRDTEVPTWTVDSSPKSLLDLGFTAVAGFFTPPRFKSLISLRVAHGEDLSTPTLRR